jgi:Nif-specific regulatory protein
MVFRTESTENLEAPFEGAQQAEAAPPLQKAPRGTSPDIALVGIYEISKILTDPNRLEVTLASVVNVLSSMLQMRRGMIVVLDEHGDPDIVATTGWTPKRAGEIRSQVPQKAVDQIAATAMPLVVHDVANHPLFEGIREAGDYPEHSKVSFIGVPVKANQRVIGTISIDRVWDGHAQFRFDEDVRFLAMVANLVGQTIRMFGMIAEDRDRLMSEQHRLQKSVTSSHANTDIVQDGTSSGVLGSSQAVQRVLKMAKTVAKSNTTVLLRGESGTGKELFARVIHDNSPRKSKPFIKLNCAALPESMLETELFGHEKGSFTGAIGQRQGRFEIANHGTLFLDEIGEISPAFQSKLLRVLQEGEFERVGGNRTIKVDVRMICATNRNLEEAVAKGEFRADLYYRISVVPLLLPPLRERKGDISQLAQAFLKKFNEENHRRASFSNGAIDVMHRCNFPGNVRELENCVRRTATLARNDLIDRDDFACSQDQCLSAMLWKSNSQRAPSPVAESPPTRPAMPAKPAAPPPAPIEPPVAALPPTPVNPVPAARAPVANEVPLSKSDAQRDLPLAGADTTLKIVDKERLLEAMERSGWAQAKAGRILGLTPRQIGYALKKYGIEVHQL